MNNQSNKIKLWFSQYIANKGYELVEEKNNPENFGSWYTIYKKNFRLIRLVWDGKESEVRIETKEIHAVDSVPWEGITSYFVKPNTTVPSFKEIELVLKKSIT